MRIGRLTVALSKALIAAPLLCTSAVLAADGAPGFAGPSVDNTSLLQGGDGDSGGRGGAGAVLTGTASSSNTSQIQGGAGGTGVTFLQNLGDLGVLNVGAGGDGGTGVQLNGPGVTFRNDGSVAGGNGGAAANTGNFSFTGFDAARVFIGDPGAGGTGLNITGDRATLINHGSISGGDGGVPGQVGTFTVSPNVFLSLIVPNFSSAGGAGVTASGAGVIFNNFNTIVGGKGGQGGPVTAQTPSGTIGGPGGDGARFTGANATIMNAGDIRGGDGGAARQIDITNPNAFFQGGSGGAGVMIAANGAVLTNSGNITGGNGGQQGSNGGVPAGSGGTGGAGVGYGFADDVMIINKGTIAGGNSGNAGAGGIGINGFLTTGLLIVNSGTISGAPATDGSGRQIAIQLGFGTNVLELQAGYKIIGDVIGFGGTNTLRLGGATDATFDLSSISTQFQVFRTFEKTGTSTWTLTGSSNSRWAINAGTLNVSGNLASFVTVNAGGTLAGTGTAASALIKAGAVLAPGNGTPGSSLNLSSLSFQSGAIYLVQINQSASTFANVGSNAVLGGTVQVALTPGASFARQYDILHSARILSTFAGVVLPSSISANVKASLSYTATDVFLNLAAALGTGAGLNTNQQNVAGAINNAFNSSVTLPPAFSALFNLTGANLGNVLTQITGEIATGSQQTTFDAMSQFMGLLTDPFIAGRGDPVASGGSATPYAEETLAYAEKRKADAFAMFTKAPPAAPFAQRWSVWAAGYGGSQTTDGNTVLGSNNTRSSLYGTAVGADYRLSPNTLAGFALAGGGTSFSVNNLGSGRSDLFQAGAFVRQNIGPAYMSAALAYGWQDITTDRTVTVAGLDRLRAQFNANALSGRLEGGYRFATRFAGITPYAAAQVVMFELPNYMEQAISGANTFALGYNAKSVTDTRSELGVRTDRSFAQANGIFTLRGRLAWAHDYDPDRAALATFQTIPGASFVVNGARHAANSALTTASAEWKWLNGWSVAGTFEGEFSSVTRSYAGKGVVRYAW